MSDNKNIVGSSESFFSLAFDFSKFRYFEKYTIYRCDRQTHEASVFDKKINEWTPINYNLDSIKPHAIEEIVELLQNRVAIVQSPASLAMDLGNGGRTASQHWCFF